MCRDHVLEHARSWFSIYTLAGKYTRFKYSCRTLARHFHELEREMRGGGRFREDVVVATWSLLTYVPSNKFCNCGSTSTSSAPDEDTPGGAFSIASSNTSATVIKSFENFCIPKSFAFSNSTTCLRRKFSRSARPDESDGVIKLERTVVSTMVEVLAVDFERGLPKV